MGKDVIIACDFAGKAETLAFLDRFGGERPFLKIGMETRDFEQIALIRQKLTENGFLIVN